VGRGHVREEPSCDPGPDNGSEGEYLPKGRNGKKIYRGRGVKKVKVKGKNYHILRTPSPSRVKLMTQKPFKKARTMPQTWREEGMEGRNLQAKVHPMKRKTSFLGDEGKDQKIEDEVTIEQQKKRAGED